jgi:hypothetical protein
MVKLVRHWRQRTSCRLCGMGLLRKTLLIGTAGLAPVKANSKKERTAKAAEKQVRLQ